MYFDSIRLVSRPDNVSAYPGPIVVLQKQAADPSAKYIFKGADGLGPPEIDVALVQTLYQGGSFQNARPQGRQVAIKVGLQPDYRSGETVSDLRNVMYAQLISPTKQPAQIELVAGTDVVATTRGYVKSCEINPFSNEPELIVTYSCISPYLQGPKVELNYTDIDFFNPVIDNPGDAPSGFHMEMEFLGPAATWDFYYAAYPDYKMVVDGDFVLTDFIIVDTRAGHREITHLDITTGKRTNLIDRLAKGSDWMMIDRGENHFVTSPRVLWTGFWFYPQYWGV